MLETVMILASLPAGLAGYGVGRLWFGRRKSRHSTGVPVDEVCRKVSRALPVPSLR